MAETKITKTNVAKGIWSEDNLIAGTDISIQQVPQPLIDDNTIGLWHFDNNDNNAIENSSLEINSNINRAQFSYPTDIKKFGTSSIRIRPTATSSSAGWPNFIKNLPSTDLTVDLWVRTLESGITNYWAISLEGSGSTDIGHKFFNIYSSRITIPNQGVSIDFEPETWVHLAIEVMGTKFYHYINGVKVYECTRTGTVTRFYFGYQTAYLNTWIDELRISNVARYQGQDFTPFELPYSNDGNPQYKINNTKDISGKQDVLTTATGYDATKTQVLKNVNGTLTWVDEA